MELNALTHHSFEQYPASGGSVLLVLHLFPLLSQDLPHTARVARGILGVTPCTVYKTSYRLSVGVHCRMLHARSCPLASSELHRRRRHKYDPAEHHSQNCLRQGSDVFDEGDRDEARKGLYLRLDKQGPLRRGRAVSLFRCFLGQTSDLSRTCEAPSELGAAGWLS